MKPVESDVPERSLEAAPPLDPPPRDTTRLKHDDVRLLDTRPADHPWHHRWPRPVRLLRRPELLDHVLAELPDQPPRRFTWRGATHRVVCADGPERILGEWWKRAGEATAGARLFPGRGRKRPSLLAVPPRRRRARRDRRPRLVHPWRVRMSLCRTAGDDAFQLPARRVVAGRTVRGGRVLGMPRSASPTATRSPAWCARCRRDELRNITASLSARSPAAGSIWSTAASLLVWPEDRAAWSPPHPPAHASARARRAQERRERANASSIGRMSPPMSHGLVARAGARPSRPSRPSAAFARMADIFGNRGHLCADASPPPGRRAAAARARRDGAALRPAPLATGDVLYDVPDKRRCCRTW